MTRQFRIFAVLVCVSAVLDLGACRANDRPAMSMAEIKIPPGANYTAADVRFMQGMIHHHAQALKMVAMAPTHGAGPSVQLLCKKIDISQKDEIATMSTWLKDRNQAVPDPNDPHPMMMPGMLTDAQLTALDQARDTTFDRLFLTDMIQHHEGAITMVADLFATPGAGQASEMFRFASDVDTDQRGEIQRMRTMLASPTHSVSTHAE
jgi:uncharacterized protein (DUF305 family)